MNRKISLFGMALVLFFAGCVTTADRVMGDFRNNPQLKKNKMLTADSESYWTPSNDHFNYVLLVPKIESGKTYRLILALHGSGDAMQRYFDNWKKEALNHAAIVVVPQLDSSLFLVDKSQDASIYYNFIEQLKKQYPIDDHRIYIAGASAGGTTANNILQKQPMFWRGAILVACANFPEAFPAMGQDEKALSRLGKLPPLLYVQGLKDGWNLEQALNQIEFLTDHGVKIQMHSYENAGHEHRPEWNKRIFEWIENIEKANLAKHS